MPEENVNVTSVQVVPLGGRRLAMLGLATALPQLTFSTERGSAVLEAFPTPLRSRRVTRGIHGHRNGSAHGHGGCGAHGSGGSESLGPAAGEGLFGALVAECLGELRAVDAVLQAFQYQSQFLMTMMMTMMMVNGDGDGDGDGDDDDDDDDDDHDDDDDDDEDDHGEW